MAEAETVPVGELLEFVIGGGWGTDAPESSSLKVAIIRGADFPDIEDGVVTRLPIRYEAASRVAKRALRDGDLMLEISGGTKDRPTGRVAIAKERWLAKFDFPVIPASFCRLMRVDQSRAVPEYLFYWLRDMYSAGRTWAYQVQSTGLANFQMDTFRNRELVRLPPLHDQRRIAGVLGALDDLIETNRQIADQCESLAITLVESAPSSVCLGRISATRNARPYRPAGRTAHYSLPAFDSGKTPEWVDGWRDQERQTAVDRILRSGVPAESADSPRVDVLRAIRRGRGFNGIRRAGGERRGLS